MHSFETICRQQMCSCWPREILTHHIQSYSKMFTLLAQTSAIFESKDVLSSLLLSLESVSGASNTDFRHCMWSSRSYRQIFWDKRKTINMWHHRIVSQDDTLFITMRVGCVASKCMWRHKMQSRDCPITSSSCCLRPLISVVSEFISISASVTASPARDNCLEILRGVSDSVIRSVTFSSNDSLALSGSSPLCFWRPATCSFRLCIFRFSELTWLDLKHVDVLFLAFMWGACQLTIKNIKCSKQWRNLVWFPSEFFLQIQFFYSNFHNVWDAVFTWEIVHHSYCFVNLQHSLQ